jgi:diadenosine tetraphosphatase ApaH/serine/threonine PP2A family protein phosphatase
VIRGNHDKVASGVESAEGFNHAARYAALWTHDQLTPANREFLTSLPPGPVVIDDLVEICHGSPDDEDEYIFEHVDAIEALRATTQQVCFFGHTHVAVAYWLSASDFDIVLASPAEHEARLHIEPDRRYLINPGSVGQPRDGDPRAAFALFDSETMDVTLHRVPYDVAHAQSKIAEAGLPEGLARRLALGK